MVSGKNKNIIINIAIAFLGCILVILVHHLGYRWYMNYFSPRSRGVTLGFVIFYMEYVVIPVVFFSAFMKVKYSLLFIGVVIFYMFYEWYGTNPLRVVLMFFSCSVGYVMVIVCSVIMKYLGKNNTAKSNKDF